MAKSLISGLKVLLADDSVTMHRAVSLALRKLSCELLLADNGSDAERIIQEQNPEVVLLDWDLPEKSGLELCREIKANPATSSTKVVLLLSSFEKMDEAELNSVPSDARLWKPFEAAVLQTMIETLVKNEESADSGPSSAVESTAPVRGQGKTAFEETAPLTPPPSVAPKSTTMKLGSRESSAPKVVSFSTTLTPQKSAARPEVPAPKARAVEATTPPPPQTGGKRLSIDDLFKGKEKETIHGEDISKELTSETFRSGAFNEDAVEGTRESDFSEIEVETDPLELEELTDDDQQSLGQMHETIDHARAQSLKPPLPKKPESSLWGDERHTPVPPLPAEKAREKLALPKRSSVENTSSGPPPRDVTKQHVWEEDSPSSSIKRTSPDDIRRMINEELEKKFKGWLKEEVESQLARVLRELDGERD